MIRFSLIIPAYNEQTLLPRLLDSVDLARRNYRNGPDAIEIIVADNASTDRTAEIAAARGARVVRVEKRAISAARNGGAKAARGEVLAFIDADSVIHPDTFNEIDRVFTDRCICGTTGLQMERRTAGTMLTFWFLVSLGSLLRLLMLAPPRANIDAGVVFVRRADFAAIGGYREHRLFAEDVQMLFDLRRLGWPRGQGFAVTNRAPALFATRKFDEHGDWHYFFLPIRMLSKKWVKRYWYDR